MEFQGYEYAGLVVAGIVVFFIIRLGIGYWASRRVETTADYIVAGRRLPIWLAAASIMATWFAAETATTTLPGECTCAAAHCTGAKH